MNSIINFYLTPPRLVVTAFRQSTPPWEGNLDRAKNGADSPPGAGGTTKWWGGLKKTNNLENKRPPRRFAPPLHRRGTCFPGFFFYFLKPVFGSIQTCSFAISIIGMSTMLSEYARTTFGIYFLSVAHLSSATTLFRP